MQIVPVLLCGGSGTRLWPLSRKSYPKQFSRLMGQTSLLQMSVQRLTGPQFASPVVLTNSDFRFIVTEQLVEVGVDPGAILIEPDGRNTAPAVLAAAMLLHKENPDALMLVAPSDHVIPDTDAFQAAIEAGVEGAMRGKLVTFGIKPTHAETGYGYLELPQVPGECTRLSDLTAFVEKPDATKAEDMLADGRFLWNAGIFLFTVSTILEAYRLHAPDLIAPVQAAVEEGEPDLGFLRLDPTAWSKVRDISIDYAVMEQADNLAVVPFSAGWSDLGGWDAVMRECEADEYGVVTHGNADAIDCRASLLRSEDDALELVGIGLDNIIAVAMPDAVLVADRSRGQDVKEVVTLLREKGAVQAEQFPMDHRPWGHFQSLAQGDRFQVKRIVVKPGASLSLQSHHHRAEHWIVVQGTAQVTIGNQVQLVTENQSVYIPLGVRHRMENPGKVPMTLIEVQTGAYLGEDDIQRFDDVYARGQGARG
ncbi:Alginate biosynthesis protein AlgA [Aliiroseovarius sp. xm-m-379]|uniref:mannose-1-phosphate guanylyltransferase/mannose-6-phosphate isomerase n=1 Tax=unclassified Aliiroseovarius TaxID=2623558 RepID=UPI0015683945|nr:MULTISPECIES: mannose-1-phosphate guanylyltransferase/mannose-6-phosphate isomerase [unclassified Aliiroseovarius]NRP26064.1 Alginate biosynthesis protein AlgA [Aliiroseovarius sp. xm-m-379]NRP30431.1 Alginate biosynthesis protein AlgA [Aliiroseovarius sp. xm-m-314]NRP34863.1 Alginate biosynthesis protein AlgA [Aliiroseovarius sp. xm-a-104]NRP42857.1 Alginate biosynthesis protein AlgA [Aliiroseovarius sp. xm-m-378]NRP49989.1 Alginate biosynthesis protein AlgA [Aliiroseovarius sp. xm-m-354]